MPAGDYSLEKLRHAYQVLNVPGSASAPLIKQTYRRLIKRWHPDRYQNGTTAHAEAAHMARLINEAYSAVAHAPLRYYVGTYPNHPNARSPQTPGPSAKERSGTISDKIPKTDRIEFWVRFFCGALLGVFVIVDSLLSIMPDSLHYSAGLALAALGIILGFGLAAARYGDRFWYSIFRRWWLWP